jgi:hypothetical protein
VGRNCSAPSSCPSVMLPVLIAVLRICRMTYEHVTETLLTHPYLTVSRATFFSSSLTLDCLASSVSGPQPRRAAKASPC